jgi:hypothetical protein
MKAKKVLLIVCLLLAISFIGYYAYNWFIYNSVLNDAEEKWLNQVFKPKEFTGVIHELNKNETGNCFSNLIIYIGEEKFSSSICLCGKNTEFANFATEGDINIKKANSFVITILKKDLKQKKEFPFPFCN